MVWKKVIQGNGPKKQGGLLILIFNKIDYQQNVIKRDLKDTSSKESIYQDDI